uniref:Uncharacterized protein n=1 Tax=Oryza meridionalis TaxID=40149 RepID=A0A0E0DWK7_9ORYZ
MEEGIHEYFCPSRHDLIGKEAGDEGCHNPAWPENETRKMDYLRSGSSHVLIGIRGPREDIVEHLIAVTVKRVMDLNGLESEHMQQKNMSREGQKRVGAREQHGHKTTISDHRHLKEPTDINPSESVMVRTARWFTGSPAYDTMGRREVIQMTYRVYGLLTPYSSENKMTNPGVHFVLKMSQYILLSFLEVTVSYGQLAFSSGFFSLVYWDHDGDDILQGNHITVGQCRKKETGRKVETTFEQLLSVMFFRLENGRNAELFSFLRC